MKKQLTPLMFALMLAFGASSAMAQGAPNQGAPNQGAPNQGATGAPPAAQPAPTQKSFSDEEIQQFADVQPEIESIRSEYSERLQDVPDPEQAATLQNEAVEKMVETVKEEGLDVETYNSIAIALQSDTELRERVESAMN
ncbi:MAG: DUF4168 domain-containing protein [Azoarcus sp.]|nr:DUF4168 domain-containing protein [Azoarcus sp.]